MLCMRALSTALALTALALLAQLAPAGAALADEAGLERVHESAHFVFYGSDRTEHGMAKLLPVAEGRFERICAQVGACDLLDGKIEVYVTEDPQQFAHQLPQGSAMAEWAVGVAFPSQQRIILRAHGTAFFSLLETFDHELSHVMVHAAGGGQRLPVWFLEGMAIHQAGEGVVQRLESAQGAAVTGQLMSFDELARFPSEDAPKLALAYAQSGLFVRFLEREYGQPGFDRLFDGLRAGQAFPDAFRQAFGATRKELEGVFFSDLERSSSAAVILRDGSIIWVAMAALFVWVAVVTYRRRKKEIADMGVSEDIEAAWMQLESARDAGEPPTLH